MSLLLLRLNKPSCLGCSSYDTFSAPFTSLVALHWTHSSPPISYLKWEAQNWTQDLRHSLTYPEYRGLITSLVLLAQHSCNHYCDSYIFFKVKLPSFLSKLTVKLWEHTNSACSDKTVFLVTATVTWLSFSKAAHHTAQVSCLHLLQTGADFVWTHKTSTQHTANSHQKSVFNTK